VGNFIKKYKFVITLFLFWRVYLFVLGLLSFWILPYFLASFPYIDQILIASGFPQWFWHWGNFDGVHYLALASRGYHAQGLHVFFPVYPLFVRLFSLVIPNFLLAGYIVSNLFAFLGGLVFYRWIKEKYNESVARWATIFLFFSPTSFFMGAVYTESLFFLLIILSFSTKGIRSAVFASTAGATRLVGLFLSLGYLIRKQYKLFLVAVLGFGIYIAYSWYFYGSPMLFLTDQANFQNARASSLSTIVTPPQVVWRYIKIFATGGIEKYDTWLAVMEFSSFVLGILFLAWATLKKKFPLEWLSFSWLALLLPSFSGTFSSMPRYLLVIFPVYIFLAQLKGYKLKIFIASLSFILMSTLTVLFLRGYFVS